MKLLKLLQCLTLQIILIIVFVMCVLGAMYLRLTVYYAKQAEEQTAHLFKFLLCFLSECVPLYFYLQNHLREAAEPKTAISVPIVAQTQPFTCGPAVGVSLLRHFGAYFTTETDLGDLMKTNLYAEGTKAENFINVINESLYNLDFKRFYSMKWLPESIHAKTGYVNYSNLNNMVNIASIVYHSLNQNFPVILGFRGSFNELSSPRAHFLLIHEVTTSKYNDIVSFRAMDPDGGTTQVFDVNTLNSLLQKGGVIIHNRHLLHLADNYCDLIEEKLEEMDWETACCGLIEENPEEMDWGTAQTLLVA